MAFNVHDVFRKIITYYTRKNFKKLNQIFIMISNFYQLKKQNIKFTNN